MEDVKVNIDLDKPCTRCGVMGATGSGLCLSCVADTVVDWEKLVGEALAAGNAEIHKLLSAHLPQIHRAYRMSDDQKLTISMSIDLAASNEIQNSIVYLAKINFVESRVRDARTGRVSSQQKLPL